MKKPVKRMIAFLSGAVMMTSLFNAAMFKTSASAKTKAADGTTLTFLIDNQAQMDGMNAVFDAFAKKTGIKVEVDLRPGGSEGDNVVKTRLATGDMADLCAYNSGSLFKALNPEANFVDLSNESYVSKLDNGFKTTVTVNGKIYGVPSGSSTGGGILYNKKVFAKLGIKPPKSWKELLFDCQKIKAAGITPVIGSYKDDWTSQVVLLADFYNVYSNNPKFADLYTANKAKFATTPIALRGFEKEQELFKKGFLNKDFLATTYETAQKMLANGTGAMYPMITFVLPNIEANYPTKVNDIGFFPLPGDNSTNNGVTVWEPGGIYIYKNSKNIDAAKKLLAFFVSPDGVAAYLSKTKPSGPMAIKGVKLPSNVYAAVKEMQTYFDKGKTAPALEFLSPLKGPNLPQICVQNGSGQKTPKENAAEYDKDVEKQAKQLGIQGW